MPNGGSDIPLNEPSIQATQLLQQYRDDLRRVVDVRLDRRLAGRLDASDVVQEVLVEASPQLQQWASDPEKSVFACLYQLARNRIWRIHRDHISRAKRAINREIRQNDMTNESAVALASHIVSRDTSPSDQLIRAERHEQVHAALSHLDEADREILVMRILEGLSVKEVSAVLGITEPAVNMRHLRALQRVRPLLCEIRCGEER